MRYKYILIILLLVANFCNAQDKINVLDFNIVDDDYVLITNISSNNISVEQNTFIYEVP